MNSAIVIDVGPTRGLGAQLATRLADYYAQAGDEKMINIEAIVDALEYLYRQAKTGWSFEIDVRTAAESW